MDKVLLVIPAYNEEKNIERVVDQLTESFPELDYIVVNDGSKDGLQRSAENGATVFGSSGQSGTGRLFSGRDEIRLGKGLPLCDPV
mgnify:CR=1 FL=1